MSIAIREAAAGDYEAISALLGEAARFHSLGRPDLFREPAGPIAERAYVDHLLADENAALFLAFVDGRPAGYLHVLVHDTEPIPILVPQRLAYVETLVVTEPLRRLGVGRALMSRAEEWAAAHGAGTVELNVHEFNQSAIAFYENLGYWTSRRRMSKRVAHPGSQEG